MMVFAVIMVVGVYPHVQPAVLSGLRGECPPLSPSTDGLSGYA